ncbi:B12-binding domain-containing radical SAM protein [Solemya velesiana gill symbiont]|uniref:Uncharacterized protein n=1 Tax=Solemya velesiana gill symbiont TaxID=1918948 RepID=A0A1T2KU98_9GAMM|nr:radical SAM protein [Solemya velesiana gill symbiont]OOZ36438.1 hypothetical protein BOW51_07135 [Solemya velesiana gill symbiont]
MRVSLVHPRLIYLPSQPPLGLGYLAACLERAGHEVQFIEGAFTEDDNEIAQRVCDFKPDLIGVSVMISYHTKSLSLASLFKEYMPKTPVIFGGPHPSVVPDDILKHSQVDFVMCGEGEDSLIKMVDMMERGNFDPRTIPGLHWRGGQAHESHTIRLTDLDEIPWPARHLFPMSQYQHRGYVVSFGFHGGNFNIMMSRGCPYKCNFCDHSVFGQKPVFRNIDDVIDEIEYVSSHYNIRNFDIMDDTFTMHKGKVFEFCNKLIERDLNLFWACRLRVNSVSREMMELMARAGCVHFSVGIESVDERVIFATNKKITSKKVLQVLGWAKEFGILTIGNFMIGNLGDDPVAIRKTLDFALDTDEIDIPSFCVLAPLPGTEVFEIGTQRGWIRSYDWDDYRMNTKDLPIMRNEAMTHQEIMDIYSEVANAVRPKIQHAMDTLHAPRINLYPELAMDEDTKPEPVQWASVPSEALREM